jgi:hypothetical protein
MPSTARWWSGGCTQVGEVYRLPALLLLLLLHGVSPLVRKCSHGCICGLLHALPGLPSRGSVAAAC